MLVHVQHKACMGMRKSSFMAGLQAKGWRIHEFNTLFVRGTQGHLVYADGHVHRLEYVIEAK
jgi:prepilin-type processing-associated H-X9-DG protein